MRLQSILPEPTLDGIRPRGRQAAMNPHKLSAYEERLRQEKRDLLASSRASADDRRPVMLDQQSVGRLSRMDAMQGQAMRQAEEVRRRERLARIEGALARLAAGEYGQCLRCGADIPAPRLEYDPAATVCVSCADAR
jgi:DnaK suppressor protein